MNARPTENGVSEVRKIYGDPSVSVSFGIATLIASLAFYILPLYLGDELEPAWTAWIFRGVGALMSLFGLWALALAYRWGRGPVFLLRPDSLETLDVEPIPWEAIESIEYSAPSNYLTLGTLLLTLQPDARKPLQRRLFRQRLEDGASPRRAKDLSPRARVMREDSETSSDVTTLLRIRYCGGIKGMSWEEMLFLLRDSRDAAWRRAGK